ncbi:UrcA family protein [Sphingomonas sp. 179-I 2A4 NHS]|uniref:UrcA family protein n=1 Tax=unclassified Sphingomonas TaxID=196159 RepID=UPI003879F3E9
MKILLPLAAVAAGYLAAPSAYAQSADAAPFQRVVSTADLALGTQDGLARLDRRLHRAAREVCAAPMPYEPHQRRLIRDCVVETVAAAATQRTALLADSQSASGILLSAR